MAEMTVEDFELTIGDANLPGGPIFTFSGSVEPLGSNNPGKGNIGPGEGRITQALEPPGGNTVVSIKSGSIEEKGFGVNNNQITLSLTGSYTPDEKGETAQPFEAHATFSIPSHPVVGRCEGEGGFTNYPDSVANAPATLITAA